MKKIFNLLAAAACVLSLQATTVTVTPNGSVCSVTVDGTTYDNVPVTVQEGINLAVVNRDGVSLLVRYTDANTVAVNGTVNGEPVDYASDAVAAYAKTFQIPNSDFEEWHSVGSNRQEPGAEGSTYSWHGFGTCFGSFAGTARGLGSLTKGEHNKGNNCAVIESANAFIYVANGTMTTGRLQAGSMSPSNFNNHSEMDINKDYTKVKNDDGLSQYGPFYTLLKLNAKPDAIKSSVKVDLKNTSDKASVSAAITDGTYYQEPQDQPYTNVAASAKNEALSNNKAWTDYTLPFSYNEGVDAKAIMVTFSTSSTPGGGSVGDKVSIDDVELIYNAAISNIALNGVTLEGFNFDAATKSYDLTYSGVALNLTAENFDVTADGQSAMVVKNVENLGGGNYRVVIAVTSPDFKNYALYTINVNFNPITGKVYILGDVNGIGWHANNGVEMSTEDQKVYTAHVTTAGENNYFRFTTELANDDDAGAWAYIMPYNIGAMSANQSIAKADYGVALPLGEWGTENNFILPAGEWNFTLDMEARTLTVTNAFNPITGKVYILGDVNDNGGWHANKGVEMTTEDQKIYTAEVTTAGSGYHNFSFTTELANDDDQGAWAYILPYRFGAKGNDSDPSYRIDGVDLNKAMELGDWGTTRNYCLEAGKWNFTIDMEARTLTVTKAALLGDINGDGKVDVTDVNVVVNIILGKDSKDNYPNADTDGNGTVDVTDVNAVVNIILGKN